MSENQAVLRIEGNDIPLPIVQGTEGESSQGTPSVGEGSKGHYVIRTDANQFLNDKATEDTSDDEFLANKDDILAYNAGTKTLKALLNGYDDVSGKLTKFNYFNKIYWHLSDLVIYYI